MGVFILVAIIVTGCAYTPSQPVREITSQDPNIDACFSLVQNERYSEALQVCEDAVNANPDNFIVHAAYAKALAVTGRAETAETLYVRALEIDPDVLNTRMEYGILLKEKGNYTGALNQFDIILTNQPDHVPAYTEKASIFRMQKNWPRAGEMLRRAIELRPGDQALRIDLVQILISAGYQSEAGAVITDASRDFPDSVSLAFSFAALFQEHRMFRQAIAQYNRVLNLDPGNGSAAYNLALCYYQERNLREAERAVMLALQYQPDSSSANLLAGQIALDRGNAAGAERYFRKAIQLDASNGAAWIMLGNVLRRNGDRSGAAEAYRQALRINPSDETAKRNLKRVY
jgi:tetratricopeptide (TPR) repeat protein